MRVTTEIEIKAQRAHNLGVETKYLELTKNIEAQLTALRVEFNQSETALRLELGAEFHSTKQNAIEVRTLVSGLQEQKQNMIDDVDKHFKEFQEKTGEMRTLIVQSEAVFAGDQEHR